MCTTNFVSDTRFHVQSTEMLYYCLHSELQVLIFRAEARRCVKADTCGCLWLQSRDWRVRPSREWVSRQNVYLSCYSNCSTTACRGCHQIKHCYDFKWTALAGSTRTTWYFAVTLDFNDAVSWQTQNPGLQCLNSVKMRGGWRALLDMVARIVLILEQGV